MKAKTKAKKLHLSRTDFPVVDSLSNLEVGRIYTTYKHDIFKPLTYNRGVKEGYVKDRVKKFKDMINNGEFIFDVDNVMVNLSGSCCDGNNRLQALKELKKPVNFIITKAEKFNVDNDSEILNNVSEFNSTNGTWDSATNYKSALMFNEPVAVAIYDMLEMLYNEYNMPTKNVLIPSRIIGLALRTKSQVRKNKTRRMYCDTKLAKKINSSKFKKEIVFMMNVMQFVQQNNSSVREWYVIKEIMQLIWKYDLSLTVVLKNLKKRGFKELADYKIASIKARCIEIVKMGNI
jgi:hypothetical protein